MKIPLAKLNTWRSIDTLIVQSIDCSLYQALVNKAGREYLVTGKDGRALRARSKPALLAYFSGYTIQRIILRHRSAYDEMIGQPLRHYPNTLEVPLGNTPVAQQQVARTPVDQ